MAGPGREILYGMLRARDRSEVRCDLVDHLLRGLGEAILRDAGSRDAGSERARKESCTVLVETVRDPSWRSSVRSRALVELMRVLEDLPEGLSILLGLLRDLAAGVLAEDKSGTLGLRLLERLYPKHMGAKEFWVYVEQLWTVPPPSVRLWDWNKSRWAGRIVRASTPGSVRVLLETLVGNAERLNKILAQNEAEEFAEVVLTRALELFGENTETAKLYDWFEVVKAAEDRPGLILTHCQGVAGTRADSGSIEDHGIFGWLRSHREIQLQLVLEGLKRSATLPGNGELIYEIGAKVPGRRSADWFSEVVSGHWRLSWRSRIPLAPLNWRSGRWRSERLGGHRWTRKILSGQRKKRRCCWSGTGSALRSGRGTTNLNSWALTEKAGKLTWRRFGGNCPAIEVGQGPTEMFDKLGRVYLEGFNEGNLSRARADLAVHLGMTTNGLQESSHNRVPKVPGTNRSADTRGDRWPLSAQAIIAVRCAVPGRTDRGGCCRRGAA